MKVSVCIVTYNQVNYIKETVLSAINQNCNFDYEILVGDDFSTDGTQNILIELKNSYPSLIRLFLRKKNIGGYRNLADLYKKAKGEYIAHLDGDDVMMPDKLTKQISILDKHPSCNICSHDVIKIDAASNPVGYKTTHLSGEVTLIDLYRNLPFFSHSSKMFRNSILDHSFYDSVIEGRVDFELHIFHAKRGNIYHINENLGMYRVNTGVATSHGRIFPNLPKRKMKVYESLRHNLPNEIDLNELNKLFSNYMMNYAKGSLVFSQIEDFKTYINISKSLKVFSSTQILLIFLSYFPSRVINAISTIFYKK